MGGRKEYRLNKDSDAVEFDYFTAFRAYVRGGVCGGCVKMFT